MSMYATAATVHQEHPDEDHDTEAAGASDADTQPSFERFRCGRRPGLPHGSQTAAGFRG